MKKWIWLAVIALTVTACAKDKTEGGESGETGGYELTSDAKVNISAASQQFTLAFKPTAGWSLASSDETACTFSKSTGVSGSQIVTVTVAPNVSKSPRTLSVQIKISGYDKQTICTIAQSGLSIPSLQSISSLKQTETMTNGIVNMQPFYVDNTHATMVFLVLGVYPNSPAAEVGLCRGKFITTINGVTLTPSNYLTYYNDLVYSETASTWNLKTGDGKSYSLTSKKMVQNPVLYFGVRQFDTRKVGYLVYAGFDAAYDAELLAAIKTLKTAGVSDIVLDLRYNGGGHVITANMLCGCFAGSKCNNKIFAYYRYNEDRMADFQQTVSDTGNDYDATVQKFKDPFSYPTYRNINLNNYALDVSTLYCLVTGNSASASELVINSLRGIDMPVVLIGENTHGKNVGMEGQTYTGMTTDEMLNRKTDEYLRKAYLWNTEYKALTLSDADYKIGYTTSSDNFLRTVLMRMTTNILDKKLMADGKEYSLFSFIEKTATSEYSVYPITFQSYNAKQYGDYPAGFTPDYPIDEYNYKAVDFGDSADPLFGKAIALITGNSNYGPKPASRAEGSMWAEIENLPQLPTRGISGMIILPRDSK